MEHNSQLQKFMHTNANIMFGINKKKNLVATFFVEKETADPESCTAI